MSGEVATQYTQPALSPSQLRGGSWRPHQVRRWLSSRAFGRGAVIVLGLAILALIGYLLLSPFWHPRTRVFVLTTAESLSLDAPLTRCTAAQQKAWQSLSPMLEGSGEERAVILPLGELASSPEAFSKACSAQGARDASVIVVAVSAPLQVQGGQVMLLTRNHHLQDPPPARLRLTDLLKTLGSHSAATKLIVLDSDRDQLDDTYSREVQDLIAKAVAETNDPSLWVLVSHLAGQRSHVSDLLDQSVFGYFVVRGLQGEADTSGDRSVDLPELVQYVSQRVPAWVEQASNGFVTQTPELYWGGGDANLKRVTSRLIPVPRDVPAAADFRTIASQSQKSRLPSPFQSLAQGQADALSGGALSRAGGAVASARSRLLNPLANLGVPLPTATAAKAAPAAPPAAKPKDADGKEIEPTAAERTALLLTQGWALRDELAARTRHGVSPVDFAPQLWREFEARLMMAEQTLRYGAPADVSAVGAMLEREILPLGERFDAPRSLEEPETLADRIAAARPRATLPVDRLPSLGMSVGISNWSATPLPESLAALQTSLDLLLSAPTREALTTWLADKPAQAWPDLREVRLARRIEQNPTMDWPLARQLLSVCRQLERTAAVPQMSSPWLRERFLAADRLYVGAEREMFDRVHADWRERAAAALTKTEALLQQLETDASQLRSIEELEADLVFRAPDYARYFDLRGTAIVSSSAANLPPLLVALRRLNDLLAKPDPARWSELTETATEAAAIAARLESPWQPQRLATAMDSELAPGEVWRWQAMLATPLVDAVSRLKLLGVLAKHEAEAAERFVPLADWRQAGHPEPKPATDADRLIAQEILGIEAGALAERVQTLAGNLSNLRQPAQWEAARRETHALLQAARLLPATWQSTLNWTGVIKDWEQAEEFRLLELGYERALAARRGAPSDEAADFVAIARAYRALAEGALHQPALSDPATAPVSLVAPATGSLMEPEQIELPIELISQRSYPVPVWLAIDYDPKSLAISSPNIDRLYAWDERTKLVKESGQPGALLPWPATSDSKALPAVEPSVTLLPGQTQALRLRVTRLALPELPSRVVLHVITRESAQRHAIDIDLPTRPRAKLVVRGTPQTWSDQDDQLQLHPFANRKTVFEFDLAQTQPRPFTGHVELYVPRQPVTNVPRGAVPPAIAQRMLARFEVGLPVGVTEPQSIDMQRPQIPLKFAPPKPKKEDAAAGAAPPPVVDPKAPVPMPHGLIAAIFDEDEQRVALVHLPAWPQRPRRMLRAVASYDAQRERVVIQVSAPNPEVLPPDGLRIRADFGSALVTGAQAKTEETLAAPSYEATLYGEIAPQPGRVITVHVDVDDYPRAFTFQVPCFGSATNIAEQTDRLSLEIARLPAGNAYRAPAAKIAVELKIDVPPSALLSDTDLLEVGIDERSDRELIKDPVVRLRSDRTAELQLLPLQPDGLIEISTTVTDVKLNLATPGLQNVKVNLMAHALIGDREVYSAPVEVLLDGSAPRFELPQLSPGRSVPAGTAVTLSSVMVDEGQSGVASVEMAIDVAGTGAFAEKPPPVVATQNAQGRWEAKLETKDLAPGTYTLLIRATDRVGNVSAFMPLKGLTIEGGDPKGAAGVKVSGIVMFGQRPMAGFDVTLTDGPAKPLPVKTNAKGEFVFESVPAGKYKVSAKGIVRNKPSLAELSITVPAAPGKFVPVELQVR